jgi:hypothetical protein
MQDFEGQRLAEMLTTVLLGAAGVCGAFLLYAALLITTDHCLPCRLLHTRHSTIALLWPRRHRPHFPCRRATVAVLQQEPRRLAASKQCDTSLQY